MIGREKVKSYVVLKLFDVIGGFPNTGPESPIQIWQRPVEVHGLFQGRVFSTEHLEHARQSTGYHEGPKDAFLWVCGLVQHRRLW